MLYGTLKEMLLQIWIPLLQSGLFLFRGTGVRLWTCVAETCLSWSLTPSGPSVLWSPTLGLRLRPITWRTSGVRGATSPATASRRKRQTGPSAVAWQTSDLAAFTPSRKWRRTGRRFWFWSPSPSRSWATSWWSWRFPWRKSCRTPLTTSWCHWQWLTCSSASWWCRSPWWPFSTVRRACHSHWAFIKLTFGVLLTPLQCASHSLWMECL